MQFTTAWTTAVQSHQNWHSQASKVLLHLANVFNKEIFMYREKGLYEEKVWDSFAQTTNVISYL